MREAWAGNLRTAANVAAAQQSHGWLPCCVCCCFHACAQCRLHGLHSVWRWHSFALHYRGDQCARLVLLIGLPLVLVGPQCHHHGPRPWVVVAVRGTSASMRHTTEPLLQGITSHVLGIAIFVPASALAFALLYPALRLEHHSWASQFWALQFWAFGSLPVSSGLRDYAESGCRG